MLNIVGSNGYTVLGNRYLVFAIVRQKFEFRMVCQQDS